ncbi:hypothetical protein [Thermococcus sp. 5-4]|uniref:hypothetical protein n=1 Tax=Thermococcus sp. 5-4 TaxID=2008440 RepID=UPI000B4A3013|nr:hypothetical protein [Thermococcus sp. 5-4]ASA77443.1 hypothetical protein CDI07_03750 [Thermococcus sp. 5-4]
MNTRVVSNGSGAYVSWVVNPFEPLYKIWPEVARIGNGEAIPHLVGTLKLSTKGVVDFDVRAVAHEKPTELVFSDRNEVLFILPVKVEDGVEGAYLKIMKSLEGAL